MCCLKFPCLPLLQGVDPSFLEELLRYLRQQRRQLDESQGLLETLEQQKQHRHDDGTASRVAVETSLSGTIPSPSATKGGGDGGRGKGRASRVDLKSLYNHCTFCLRLSSLLQQLKIYTAFPLITIAHAQHKMLNAQHQIYYYFLSLIHTHTHTHTHTHSPSLSLQW